MKHKVKRIHFVGKGGADMNREQGPREAGMRPAVNVAGRRYAVTEGTAG